MAKWIWSIDPLAVSRLRKPAGKSPLSRIALARLGILARKIPRVQAELARLRKGSDFDLATWQALAREIARQLV